MAGIRRIHADHPFVGTWRVKDDVGGLAFTITAAPRGFAISAVDRDGEVLEIADVRLEGDALHFSLHVPSNGYRVQHSLRVSPETGGLDDHYVATFRDVLMRDK